MTSQEEINLNCLREAILNGTASVEGCWVQARKYLKGMEVAINAYTEDMKDGDSLDKAGSEGEVKPSDS